jgi:hypothetical protein
MVKVTFTVRRPFPGPVIRVVVLVVIYLLVVRQVPGAVLPLSAGSVLGGWLGAAVTAAASGRESN